MKQKLKNCEISDLEECPIPIAEDRFEEALHFMQRLESEYHDPRLFRFNLNALLSSLRATVELLHKEMEKSGRNSIWLPTKARYKDDFDLNRVALGRNVTLHQKAIYDGSTIRVGMFRGRRHKLSVGGHVANDKSSQALLEEWQSSEMAGYFLDSDRSDVGEQYGVWRQYFLKELNDSDEALVACWKAVIRTNDLLAEAHHVCGGRTYAVPAEELLAEDTILRVTVLLESDVDPSLPKKWGWS